MCVSIILALSFCSVHRHLALEESLTDKQQLLTRMADCLSWLQQAEQHLANQKPLGGDYYQIHDQYLAHKVTGNIRISEPIIVHELFIYVCRGFKSHPGQFFKETAVLGLYLCLVFFVVYVHVHYSYLEGLHFRVE